MAINLVNTPNTDTFLHVGSPILTGGDMTFAIRFNPSAFPPIAQTLIAIERTPAHGFGGFEGFYLRLASVASGQCVQAVVTGPGFSGGGSNAGTYSLNTWQTAAMVISGTTITAYYNGVAGTPGALTGFPSPSGLGDTIIGAGYTSTPGSYYAGVNGCIADAAIWSFAADGVQITSYDHGFAPSLINLKNLVLGSPFLNNANRTLNICGAPLSVTIGTGSISDCANGPKLILPAGFQFGKGSIAPTPSRKLYFIERMDNRLWPQIEDAWCLDSALALPQSEPDATLQVSSATGDGTIRSYSIINGGSGYTSPIGQIEDAEGDGTGATVSFGLTSGVITTATATAIGSDYVRPILTVLDTTGTGAAVLPILTNYTTMSASAAVFDSGNVGDIVRVGAGKLEVVAVTDPLTATGNVIMPILAVTPNDPDDTPLPATSGNWTMTTPTTTVSGLWHLEGVTVSALADGGVVGNLTVADGSVTLPVEASAIVAGLPFIARAQTLSVESQGGGTIQSRRKGDFQVVIRVENSRAPEVGVNQPDAAVQPGGFDVPWTGMTQVRERSVNVPPGQPVPLYSGDYEPTNVFGTWDTRGQVAVQQSNPLPLTVTALIPWIRVSDTPS